MHRKRLKANAEQQAEQERRDLEESKLKNERAKQAAAHEQQMQRVERQLEEAKAAVRGSFEEFREVQDKSSLDPLAVALCDEESVISVQFAAFESEPGTQRDSRARFLFILRHPLANVLAHRPFIPGFRSIADLMQNWLMVAEYIAKDRVTPPPRPFPVPFGCCVE